jgi:hypothetical protein
MASRESMPLFIAGTPPNIAAICRWFGDLLLLVAPASMRVAHGQADLRLGLRALDRQPLQRQQQPRLGVQPLGVELLAQKASIISAAWSGHILSIAAMGKLLQRRVDGLDPFLGHATCVWHHRLERVLRGVGHR